MKKTVKTTYLFANWKMYLDYDESNILANAIALEAKKIPEDIKIVIFPSALALYVAGQVLDDVNIGVGAQNVYWVDKGGYTGEMSAIMFKEAGCKYALVGHSERRHQFHESNHNVRQKIEACLASGLTPVLCVGETIKERDEDKTEEVIEIQLRSALEGLSLPKGELFIAYEPVWAISKGTGKNDAGGHCDELEANRLHKLIRKITNNLISDVNPIILFGGSVRPDTVSGYLKQPEIQGVLVGAASTKLESWSGIIKSAAGK